MRFQRFMSKLDLRAALSHPAIYNLHSTLFAPQERKARFMRDILKVVEGDRVLDIGCGTALLLDYFPPAHYVGFDLSASYIDDAKARAPAGRMLSATFEHKILTREAAKDMEPFDLVMAIGVVHHLDDDEAATLFAVAHEALKPGGRLITCDGAFVAGQNPLARLFLNMDRGEHIRAPDAYLGLARSAFSDVTRTVHHDLNALPYTHCVLECTRM